MQVISELLSIFQLINFLIILKLKYSFLEKLIRLHSLNQNFSMFYIKTCAAKIDSVKAIS